MRLELSSQNTGRSVGVAFYPPVATVEYLTPNEAGIVPPEGFDAPFQHGPTSERVLGGWFVPPGVDDDAQQVIAGAVVTWNRNEASTRLLTGALPYPGQKRGNA